MKSELEPATDPLELATRSLHLLPQAERSHVCPHLLDVAETFRLGSTFAGIPPAKRVVLVCRPYGVLLFIIEDYFINGIVFFLFHICYSPDYDLELFSPWTEDGEANQLLLWVCAIRTAVIIDAESIPSSF